jgi:hypothetical protein
VLTSTMSSQLSKIGFVPQKARTTFSGPDAAIVVSATGDLNLRPAHGPFLTDWLRYNPGTAGKGHGADSDSRLQGGRV